MNTVGTITTGTITTSAARRAARTPSAARRAARTPSATRRAARTTSAARRAALTALAAVLGLGLAACSVTTQPQGEDTAEKDASTATPSTSETSATSETGEEPDETATRTPDVLGEEQVWLYEVPSEANFDSGGQVSVVVAGGDGTSHPDSTTQWLGCDGVAAVTTYTLDGGYAMLDGALAFREGTPSGVVAEVQIETDLGVLGAYRVESDGGVPLQLVLDGASTLTVTAQLSAGLCGTSDVGYLVFVDTALTPA